jgi:hypothetical protein
MKRFYKGQWLYTWFRKCTFLYFKVHGCVLFWPFLLKMHKCYFIGVFEISCWKNNVKSLFWTKKFRTKNMCGFFWGVDHVFVLSDNCPNQHFFRVTNMRYVLLAADFLALYFFREFPTYFLKYGNPYKHWKGLCCWLLDNSGTSLAFLFAAAKVVSWHCLLSNIVFSYISHLLSRATCVSRGTCHVHCCNRVFETLFGNGCDKKLLSPPAVPLHRKWLLLYF